jgi:hypothetical protein
MEMILFEEKDLLDIARNTLDKFDESNLKSEAAQEAIARKIVEGVRHEAQEIEGESYFSKHQN